MATAVSSGNYPQWQRTALPKVTPLPRHPLMARQMWGYKVFNLGQHWRAIRAPEPRVGSAEASLQLDWASASLSLPNPVIFPPFRCISWEFSPVECLHAIPYLRIWFYRTQSKADISGTCGQNQWACSLLHSQRSALSLAHDRWSLNTWVSEWMNEWMMDLTKSRMMTMILALNIDQMMDHWGK